MTNFTYYDTQGFPTVDQQSVLAAGGQPALPAAQDKEGTVYAQNQVLFCKTLLLNSVFDSLVGMIDVLQTTAVAQANRVNFLSEWQNAYTDALNQIHSFAAYNGDPYSDPNNTTDSTLMTNLNQTNSIYSTTEQNRRSVISDDSKSLNTSVNQSSNSVNNQSSLASSFLQEQSTLLSAVFKSSA